jgi:lysophospholipase L1-like esterase
MKKIVCFLLFPLLFAGFQPAKKTWVAIGDSITYLNDHADETGNRVQKGYLTRVTEKLSSVDFINKGYNGWTVVRIATEIEKLGIPKADIYSVFLGTNDWWQGKPLGTLEDYKNGTGVGTVCGAYRIIIDKIRSLNPEAKILLITPMQRVDFVYLGNYKNNAYGSYKDKNGQQLEQFADAITAIAKEQNFPLVDLYHNRSLAMSKLVRFKRVKDPATAGAYRNYTYPEFIGVPFDPEKDEYPYPLESIGMTYDGLHPSNAGNAEIAKQVIRKFTKWVR